MENELTMINAFLSAPTNYSCSSMIVAFTL